MSDTTLELTDQEVLLHAHGRLQEHLPLHAEGSVGTPDDLLHVLLGVAAKRGTLESVCADLVGPPDPQTLRGSLKEHLGVEELPELERRLKAALAAEMPRRVRRPARAVAIDCHDRPDYGKPSQANGLWVRGKATDGTTRFYRVATAYVRLNGLRVTLALHCVRPPQDPGSGLDTLLTALQRQGIRVAGRYLDKGFDGIAVMAYLTRRQQPAVSACPVRGRTGGTRARCRGTPSYLTFHTFTGAHGPEFPATLAVGRGFTPATRTHRLTRRAEWRLFMLSQLFVVPPQVRRRYRRRFGIETSSRGTGQVRGWTTAPKPAYRFVWIARAVVLLNVWIHLRWIFTQVPRRGRRWLDTTRFQLRRFARFIPHALERLYGCVQAITAPALPRC